MRYVVDYYGAGVGDFEIILKSANLKFYLFRTESAKNRVMQWSKIFNDEHLDYNNRIGYRLTHSYGRAYDKSII